MKILKTAQAHVTANWKTYALILGALVLWANRDSIVEMLNLKRKPPTKDEASEEQAAAQGNKEGSAGIKQSDGTIVQEKYVYAQSVIDFSANMNYWYEGWAITSSTQAERCKIAQEILAMSDAKIIEQNAHYIQTFKKSMYTTMMGVYNDPCSYWAEASDYDLALSKIQRATANMVTA